VIKVMVLRSAVADRIAMPLISLVDCSNHFLDKVAKWWN
jgi:hypothetical protein